MARKIDLSAYSGRASDLISIPTVARMLDLSFHRFYDDERLGHVKLVRHNGRVFITKQELARTRKRYQEFAEMQRKVKELDLLQLRAAGRMIGLDESTIRKNYVDAGRIPFIRFKDKLYVQRSDIETIAAREQKRRHHEQMSLARVGITREDFERQFADGLWMSREKARQTLDISYRQLSNMNLTLAHVERRTYHLADEVYDLAEEREQDRERVAHLMTVSQAAEMLGVTNNGIHALMERGKLEYTKIDGKKYIRPQRVIQILENRKREAKAYGDTLSVSETAERLKVPIANVYSMIYGENISAERINGRLRIPASEIKRMEQSK